jgi:hypothetical protein
MGELRVQYLEMIQAVIARMAENQVTLRTWSVALGTAVIGYAASTDSQMWAALLGVLPAVTFWILDGYYLALERKFRALYAQESALDDDKPNFSMKISALTSDDWWEGCGRPAVWLVHSPVLLLAVAIGLWGLRK